MPTRLIHDTLLTSPSIRVCTPMAQDAFPRFLLLADDFGCFEAEPRLLVGRGWPYRSDVTEQHVRSWMVEYAMADMLRLWEQDGRWYGFLTGWWNFQRFRKEYSSENPKGSKRRTPAPPDHHGDVAGFSEGRAPVQRLPGNFPGGNSPGSREASGNSVPRNLPGGKTVPASAQADSEIRHAAGGFLDFPPGKGGVEQHFPDTQPQPQSQAQSQAQPEETAARAGKLRHEDDPPAPSLAVVLDAYEKQQQGVILGGDELIDVQNWVARGYKPERIAEAIRVVGEAMRAGPAKDRPKRFWACVSSKLRDTPTGQPIVWHVATRPSRGALEEVDYPDLKPGRKGKAS